MLGAGVIEERPDNRWPMCKAEPPSSAGLASNKYKSGLHDTDIFEMYIPTAIAVGIQDVNMKK